MARTDSAHRNRGEQCGDYVGQSGVHRAVRQFLVQIDAEASESNAAVNGQR